MTLLPRPRSALRRLCAHAALALAMLFAQMGAASHLYTAHRLDTQATAQATEQATETALKLKTEHGGQASETCQLCLAYSIFGGAPPVQYDSAAVTSRVDAWTLPQAHVAPFFPFLSYASRAPPGLTA
jgi:hypothetical protein